MALALIAVVTFCDVIARKVFNRGFTFTVEMTEMAMALIVFLGVGLVTHQRGHIVVDVRDAPAVGAARASGSGSSPTSCRSASC